METILDKARAFAASKAIKPQAGKARESATRADWEEWVQVAITLRTPLTRVDVNGFARPMTWTEVAAWIQTEFPKARLYEARTLKAKLSAKAKQFIQ